MFSRWKKLILLVLSLTIIISVVAINSAEKKYSKDVFPLKKISFQGDWKYLDMYMLHARLQEAIDSDFVNVSLSDVQAAVEKEPWVKVASVRRIWPDRLHVSIEERRPLARWGNLGFVDLDHELVKLELKKIPDGLAILDGPVSTVSEVAEKYRIISDLIEPLGLKIKELRLDDRRSWKMTLSDEVEIFIGVNHVNKRIRRLVMAYDDIQQFSSGISIIDMRYTNGLALHTEIFESRS